MAISTTDKKPAAATTGTNSAGFGAYANAPGINTDLTTALEKPPVSKTSGSMDFTDNDKRWLKELGITTAHEIDFNKAWGTEATQKMRDTRKWNQTYGGRLAIRSVSRSIVGAAFYAAAQTYAGNALKGYTPDKAPENILQRVTQIIDKTVGRTIFSAVKAVTKNEATAQHAITFRDTRNFGYGGPGGEAVMGRSVGHEAMAITFDFAAMSFGDYMTRYVLGLFDPNARVKWLKDGKLSLSGALKDVLKNVWTGVSYAAGEDIGVAIPYIYGMRLQRNIINKFSPGFKYDSDAGMNGGSVKVDKNGKITGNYQLEGMLDLMGRFSWYNVGTKMFRDTYNWIARESNSIWRGDRKLRMPTVNPASLTPGKLFDNASNAVANGARYLVRTTIKVMMYMTPATFFFYITRTPQSKYRGLAINPELGILGREEIVSTDSMKVSASREGGVEGTQLAEEDASVKFKPLKPGSELRGEKIFFRNDANQRTYLANNFNPFTEVAVDAFTPSYYAKSGTKAPWHDKITNPIGRVCYSIGSGVNELLQSAGLKFGWDPKKTEIFARTYANASISYGPYFGMKTDVLAASWDTERMDMGFDRMLGGAARFNWGEFTAGAGEVFRTWLWQPFPEPMREQMAQAAMLRDPERGSNEAFQTGRSDLTDSEDSGPEAVKEKKKFASEKLRASRPTYGTLRQSPQVKARETGFAAQEALNKLEAELHYGKHTVH